MESFIGEIASLPNRRLVSGRADTGMLEFMQRISRRGVLRAGAAAVVAARALAQPRGERVFAYVGCYTTPERYARGDGIHAYRVDSGSGGWTHMQHLGGLVNPSFLTMRRDRRFLYAAHGDESYATAFTVDPSSGALTVLNKAATGGRNGVHLALDPSGRFLIVANYSSGSVAVLPVAADGKLADAIHVVALPGQPGPHRVEQTSSHPA